MNTLMDHFEKALQAREDMNHIKFIVSVFILLCIPSCAQAETVTRTWDDLVDAIYIAEGGQKAKKPFGILSVKCDGYNDCRRICMNTVVNNMKRFKNYGHKTHKDYLSFLASRYAPVGAANDPTNLNKHWLKNIKSILKNMEK